MVDTGSTPVRNPPAGFTTNLINPPSILYRATACNAICLVLIVIVVATRLYTRAFIVRSIGRDDYVNIVAMCFFLATMATFQYMGKWGLGIHLWNVTLGHYSPHFLRSWTIAAILYSLTMLFTKLSILVLYRRLFPIKNFTIRWWLVTLFTIGYSIGGVCASLFACTPIVATWDINVVADHCTNTAAFYIANGVLNCISDLLILCLPIPIVWNLSLRFKQKVILSVLFAFGSVSCVISIVRLKSIIVFLHNGDSDITYDLVGIVIWSQVELSTGMLCACVPTLRPFFDRCLGSVFSSEQDSLKQGPYTRTTEKGMGRGKQASRFSQGHDMELGVQPSKNQTLVTTTRAESDTGSTDEMFKNCPDAGDAAHEDGIMVQTSYRVQTATSSFGR